MKLDGFVEPRTCMRSSNIEEPRMTMSNGLLWFNAACKKLLNGPDRVSALINEDTRMLALVPGKWVSFSGSRATFCNKELLKCIERVSGKPTRIRSPYEKKRDTLLRYRCDGVYDEEAYAVLFDLTKLVEIERY